MRRAGQLLQPHGSGRTVARRVSQNLDAKSEGALVALAAHWGLTSASAVKRALIDTALRECAGAYEAALGEVRARRMAETA